MKNTKKFARSLQHLRQPSAVLRAYMYACAYWISRPSPVYGANKHLELIGPRMPMRMPLRYSRVGQRAVDDIKLVESAIGVTA